ncbi:MAG TPA: trypsin-like peptidase domain-containing protein [Chloroflexia bacterium]|jgi:hypothetical protein
MPPWNPQLSNLRNVLAGIYWETVQARRIALQAGMNPIFLQFTNSPITTWQSILEAANNSGRIDEIIDIALQENPAVPELVLAKRGELHLAIQAPPLSDAAWQGPSEQSQLEAIMGAASTLRPISFLERGMNVARSVARIVLADESRGSGFLTRDNLLITNNHVLPSKEAALGARVEFNYQQTAQGTDAAADAYELDPDATFLTSPKEVEGGDDWTVVRLKGDANAKWGSINLTPVAPKLKDEVIIIQHPGGGRKQIALSHNVVAFVNDKRLQYLTDTLEGSSGSPVFNVNWQIVGVHHEGGWLREPGTKMAVFRNQGIHINVIIDGLISAGLLPASS